MKLLSKTVLLLLFSCFFFSACPNLFGPKPRAMITIDVRPLPIPYHLYSGIFDSTFEVVISESSGVGGNASFVEVKFYTGGVYVSGENKGNVRFEADGSISVSFYVEFYSGHIGRPDKLKVEVKGTDDNGYSFTEQREYSEFTRLF